MSEPALILAKHLVTTLFGVVHQRTARRHTVQQYTLVALAGRAHLAQQADTVDLGHLSVDDDVRAVARAGIGKHCRARCIVTSAMPLGSEHEQPGRAYGRVAIDKRYADALGRWGCGLIGHAVPVATGSDTLKGWWLYVKGEANPLN